MQKSYNHKQSVYRNLGLLKYEELPLVSAFEKWLRRKWKQYSFTKWKKDFGRRLVGKYHPEFWDDDKIVLIHHFSERKPTIEDFAGFLKDFERFYERYDDDYEIDGAYLIIYKEYDKKAFNLLRRKMDNAPRELVKIKVLEEKIFASRAGVVRPKGISESQDLICVEQKCKENT